MPISAGTFGENGNANLPNYTAGAGSNRLVIFGWGGEMNSQQQVTAVTFGGVALTQVPGAAAYVLDTTHVHADWWYIKEASIPVGSSAWSITHNGGAPVGDYQYYCQTLFDVDQTSPIADADQIATADTVSLSRVLSALNGGWTVASAAQGRTGGITWTAPFTSDVDFSATANASMSIGFNAESATGNTTAQATAAGAADRGMALSVVTFTPFGGGGGGISMPLVQQLNGFVKHKGSQIYQRSKEILQPKRILVPGWSF